LPAPSLRQTGAERRLARRRLAESGGEHAAHDDLIDPIGVEPGAPHRFPRSGSAKRRCAEAGQATEKAADRRARIGRDDDRIGAHANLRQAIACTSGAKALRQNSPVGENIGRFVAVA